MINNWSIYSLQYFHIIQNHLLSTLKPWILKSFMLIADFSKYHTLVPRKLWRAPQEDKGHRVDEGHNFLRYNLQGKSCVPLYYPAVMKKVRVTLISYLIENFIHFCIKMEEILAA